MSQQVCLT
jgi:hypothetical protein